MKRITPHLIILLMASLLSACASKPVIEPVAHTLSISQARAAKSVDVAVRWGGEVVKIENFSDHTQVEIIARPLAKSSAPQRTDISDGRFIARLTGFIDPENIKPGRRITVRGNLVDWQEGQIGEYAYLYPKVDAAEYKIWPKQRASSRQAYPYYPYYPYGYGYDPFWDGPYFGSRWHHRNYFHLRTHSWRYQ